MDTNGLCLQLSGILNGRGTYRNGVCTVMLDRRDINAYIGYKEYHALCHTFHFESPDENGNSLVTGELVLLEREVPDTVKQLTDAGIIVSAVHSRWLFDDPRFLYVYVEGIMDPYQFARILSQIVSG